jgi:hypothetical protein
MIISWKIKSLMKKTNGKWGMKIGHRASGIGDREEIGFGDWGIVHRQSGMISCIGLREKGIVQNGIRD